MAYLALALFLWCHLAIDNWDGNDESDLPVDDIPDLPPT